MVGQTNQSGIVSDSNKVSLISSAWPKWVGLENWVVLAGLLNHLPRRDFCIELFLYRAASRVPSGCRHSRTRQKTTVEKRRANAMQTSTIPATSCSRAVGSITSIYEYRGSRVV